MLCTPCLLLVVKVPKCRRPEIRRQIPTPRAIGGGAYAAPSAFVKFPDQKRSPGVQPGRYTP